MRLLVVLLVLLPAVQAASAPDWPQRMVGATTDIPYDGTGIVVAVLDSGIDHTHPELAGKFWVNPDETDNGLDDDGNGHIDDLDGWDFCHDTAPRQRPGFWHGTSVAGVLAGEGGSGGVRGVAPGVRLMDVQVYCDDNDYPEGDGVMDRDSVRAGLEYAVRHGADIIVMSLQLWEDQPPGLVPTLQDLLVPRPEEFQAAEDAGILVVGAAGNFGQLGPSSPGDQPHVLTVGATTGCGFRHGFSNYGPAIELWAPGRAYAPTLGGAHDWVAGTSFAAPMVAGAAALLLQREPGLGPAQVAQRLVAAGQPSVDGPVLDVHGLFDVPRPDGQARLALQGDTAVRGPHYVQYASDGDEPALLRIEAEGYGAYCIYLDPSSTYTVKPSLQQPLRVAARAYGPTWAGPWRNDTFTFDADASPNEERPVWVQGNSQDAAKEAPVLAPFLALAVALLARRR